MCLNDEIKESAMINFIAHKFARSPLKLNNIHESDAEIIEIGNSNGNHLAVTTDSLAEELSSGLYDDPYLAGWMLATVNLSDLAAVGATPLGLLISLTLKASHNSSFIDKMTDGISDACQAADTFILGGDTNHGNTDYLSGCALGLVEKNKIISRVGAKPGDKIYITAPAGKGNMFAFMQLNKMNNAGDNISFKPSARLNHGRLIGDYADCCIDTSDGVIHALDTLVRLNNVKAVICNSWDCIIDAQVAGICRNLEIPPWLPLAGIHGEFELCFAVAPEKRDDFIGAAARQGWSPIPVGEIAEGKGVYINQAGSDIFLDTARIRNLAYDFNQDIYKYMEKLFEFAGTSGIA